MLGVANVPRLPRLKRRREEAALTQGQLAERAGVARTTIVALERGAEARPSTLRKLADALACEPRELLEPAGDDTGR